MLSPALFGAIGGVFVLVAIVAAVATWTVLTRSAPEQRRIRSLVGGPGVTAVIPDGGRLTDAFDPTLVRLSRLVPKSPRNMSRLQKRLTRAGYRQPSAAVYYSLAQMIGPIVLGGSALLVVGIADAWMYAIPAAVLGFMLPGFYVQRQITLRQKAIRNGLPDALDMLTVCVEAGSGLDQAIVKTSDELDVAHPDLADELRIITTEVRDRKSVV